MKLFSWKKWLSKIFSNFFNCSFMIFICSFAAVSALDYEVNFLFVICIVYCTYLIMLNCKTRLLETGVRRIPLLLDLKNTSTAHKYIEKQTDWGTRPLIEIVYFLKMPKLWLQAYLDSNVPFSVGLVALETALFIFGFWYGRLKWWGGLQLPH